MPKFGQTLKYMERKLAHIEKIETLSPIEGADKIVVAQVLGWQCVVKKGEFKVGDAVVYVEVDSIMPQTPEFEFLRERKFRVKTIKLKGQISQGLVLPLEGDIKRKYESGRLTIGDDVTDILGIQKYLTPTEREEVSREAIEKNRLKKYLRRYSFFRRLFSQKKKDKFPYWVVKTDEERIHNMPNVLLTHKEVDVYVTEKIDCLDANTLILTVQGLQTIKEICESEGKVFVLSQNVETGKVSFKPVLNKVIKHNENKRWVKIILEDNTELLVTDDHRIWLPDLQCYRQVKDLTEKDFLLKLC